MREITLKELRPIDLDNLSNVKQQATEQIENFGFLLLTDKWLAKHNFNEAYNSYSKFFNLSEEVKRKYTGAVSGLNGYFPYHSETAISYKEADPKEFWHMTRPFFDPDKYRYPKNYWPKEAPEFEQISLDYYQKLDEYSAKALNVFESYLDLPFGELSEMAKEGCSILRVIHYPPQKGEITTYRAAPHTGIQLIGIQPPATHKGLEFHTPHGEWIYLGEEFNNCISINIGEMLEAVSARILKATLHRVSTRIEDASTSRYAMVFFHHVPPQLMVSPHPQLLSKNPHSQFKPIRAIDWIKDRINKISENKNF